MHELKSPPALLPEFGFVRDGGHPSFARRAFTLETGILVEGDHAVDRADLYFTDEEGYCGIFYAPTLLERLLTEFEDEAYIRDLLAELLQPVDRLELVAVGGTPMILLPLPSGDLDRRLVALALSGMKKLIGILDYFLPRRLEDLLKEKGTDYVSKSDPL